MINGAQPRGNSFRSMGTLSSCSSRATQVGRAVEGNRVVLANLISVLADPSLILRWNGEAKGLSSSCPPQLKLRKSEQHSTVERAGVSRSQKVGLPVLICH